MGKTFREKENFEKTGIFLSSIPVDKLILGIGDYILSKLASNGIKFQPETKNTNWLTHGEASAYLKKTPAALYKLTSTRVIKFTKRGKPNYYRIEDLDAYMEAGLVKTTNEIAKEVRLTPKRNYSITKNKQNGNSRK